MKINAKRAEYFKNHKDKSVLWFTSDDRCYYSDNGAVNHAAELKKQGKSDDVDTIRRSDVAAWESECEIERAAAESGAGDTGAGAEGVGEVVTTEVDPSLPVIADADSPEVKTAKQALIDAINAKKAVPSDATVKVKGDATKAVNAAKKALDALVGGK